jgi:hypothetical protein
MQTYAVNDFVEAEITIEMFKMYKSWDINQYPTEFMQAHQEDLGVDGRTTLRWISGK